MFTTTCPACLAELAMSTRRLVVWIDAGVNSGEVLFRCLSCHDSVTVPVDPAAVTALELVGPES